MPFTAKLAESERCVSMLDDKEVNRAQVGPRELKDPRSRQYAIQTLYALKRYAESLRCDEELVAKELEEIERYRHWEVLGYESKEAMLATEVSALGRQNIATLAKHGGAREGAGKPAKDAPPRPKRANQGGHSTLKKQTASHWLARLDRDHAELAAQVRAGRMTANAAAIQAGFRRRMVSLPAEPALLAQAILARHTEAADLIAEARR